MSYRNRHAALGALLVCALALTALGLHAANYSVANRSTAPDNSSEFVAPLTASPNADFDGYLRLYVVEPNSRWNDYNGQPYHFATLDLVLDTAISLNTGDRFVHSRFWEGTAWALSQTNVMVIAVLSNGTPHTHYSDPPSLNPFTAYYNDACAYARPGFCDSSNASSNSTHTVFIEEGTAVWCPYCPAPNYYLYYVYNQGVLNFIYTALVDDRNSDASKRLDEFNIKYFPTCYLDGGYQILIGGYDTPSAYQNAIAAADGRAVSGANVMVKVSWLTGGDLQIDWAVALGTPINSCGSPATPTGDIAPLINNPFLYTTSETDPQNDDLWYQFDWGDGVISDWYGPYVSGDPCSQTHQWSVVGPYEVRVKSRDTWLAESAWSAPLTVNAVCCTLRGDFNDDGSVKVSDLTALINFLFRSGVAPACTDHGDVNADGSIKVSDLTMLINFLFRGGPAPAACS